MIKMLISQEWLRDKSNTDPDLYQEIGNQMQNRIYDRNNMPWFYQFGSMYGNLKGHALRHVDDILKHVKND